MKRWEGKYDSISTAELFVAEKKIVKLFLKAFPKLGRKFSVKVWFHIIPTGL